MNTDENLLAHLRNPYEPPQAVEGPISWRCCGRLVALTLARFVVVGVAAVALFGAIVAVVLLLILMQGDQPLERDPPLPLMLVASVALAALFGAMWVADRWLVCQLRARP